MNCPKSMVGRVIGKQGDTIKQLQRNTGANIQIDQSSDPCVITLTGQMSSINNAMRDINTIINDNGMGGMAGGGGMYGARWPALTARFACAPAGLQLARLLTPRRILCRARH